MVVEVEKMKREGARTTHLLVEVKKIPSSLFSGYFPTPI